jgi:hypothetical protein
MDLRANDPLRVSKFKSSEFKCEAAQLEHRWALRHRKRETRSKKAGFVAFYPMGRRPKARRQRRRPIKPQNEKWRI